MPKESCFKIPENAVIEGDALEILKKFPDNYVDSIVTDPPAGIAFMSQKWDNFASGNRGTSCRKTGSGNKCESPGFAKDVHWDKSRMARDRFVEFITTIMTEALRVLKPGAHMLCWALPRTSHWTAWAIENAGYEIRDCVYYVFGSGFPKSLNIGKAVDKLQGNKRKMIGKRLGTYADIKRDETTGQDSLHGGVAAKRRPRIKIMDTKGNSPWEGWGTALKPAVECWWLCRKPLSEKTVAKNILKWGTGGINIDGCRIGYKGETDPRTFGGKWKTDKAAKNVYEGGYKGVDQTVSTKGRFPSHLIHDGSPEVLAIFPHSKSGAMKKPYIYTNTGFSLGKPAGKTKQIHDASEGSAARFFYCAKPSRRERNVGLDGFEKEIGHNRFDKCAKCGGYILQNPTRPSACKCENPVRKHNTVKGNFHPTVKSLSLMKYLVKLITPPGGLVLDIFAGSGSTLIAAKILGYKFIGIEKEKDYCEIARKRIQSAQKNLL